MVYYPNSEEKRYYLRRRQIVLLFVGFTITATIIYFLGLLTGLRMAEQVVVNKESRVARIPVEPLIQGADSAPGVLPEQQPVSHDKWPESTGSKPPDQDYRREQKRLEQFGKGETEPMGSKVKKSDSTPIEESPGQAGEQTASPSGREDKSRPSESVRPKVKAGMWTVQVHSNQDEASAVVWEYAMKTRGYDAYTVKAVIKGKVWYRVRVGHSASQNEAEALRKVLVSKEGLRDAFLARQQENDVIISTVKSQ